MERGLKRRTRRGFALWLVVVAVAVVAAFVVPYGILTSFPPSLWVYGFWTIFGFVIIGFIYWGVRDWTDTE